MRKILLSVLMVAVVGGVTIAATRAYFTSQNVLGQSTMTSGRLTLDLNGADTKIVNLGDLSNLAPGDESDTAEIVVDNVGTINFGWVGKFVLSGDSQLAKVIYIKEAKMEFLAPSGKTWSEPADQFITDGKGSGLYPTHYNWLASQDTLGVISLDTWNRLYNGMVPSGPYFEGALKPGYQYKLTFKLAMHPTAGNTYQNRSMGLGFQANAFQLNTTALSETMTALGTPYSTQANVDWLNTQISNQH